MSKEPDITIEEARELVSDAALWPRVRDFLWDFAPQVHQSWLGDLKLCETLGEGRDGRESPVSQLMSTMRVKQFVLSSLGVEPCFHAFPKSDWSRLLLLDGATLESIAKWLGALVASGALRRVTDGAVVRKLRKSLSGVYPEVFGYTEYFRKLNIENSEFKIRENGGEIVAATGCSLLSALIDHLPGQLLVRLRLKLPKALSTDESSDCRPSTFNFQLSNLQLLLKLRFPEAYSLCC